MLDHHCIFQHGWFVSEWCDQCAFDWLAFEQAWHRSHPGGSPPAARRAYEAEASEWCDEAYPPALDPEGQPPPAIAPGILNPQFFDWYEAARRSSPN